MHNYLYITHAHCNPDSIFYHGSLYIQVGESGTDMRM